MALVARTELPSNMAALGIEPGSMGLELRMLSSNLWPQALCQLECDRAVKIRILFPVSQEFYANIMNAKLGIIDPNLGVN